MVNQEQKYYGQLDKLTLFFEKEGFKDFLDRFIFNAADNKKKFSLALIAFEGFKKFKTKFDLDFNNELLKYTSSSLRLTFQDVTSYFFRYEEDEFFVAIVPDKDAKELFSLVRQYNYNMQSRPFLFKNRLFKIKFNCGIASFPSDGDNVNKLVQKISQAVYFSKRDKRNFIVFANRVQRAKLVNFILILASWFIIIFSLSKWYQLSFNDLAQRTIHSIRKSVIFQKIKNFRNIRFTAAPKYDVVVLKDGTILEGYILRETEKTIELSFALEKGEGSTVLDKSDIINMKYGSE
ncbi:GGDEF domain-containing protein [Candidatus Omnitrophota bacterium]